MAVKDRKKTYCGDNGGTNRFGKPCERPAGWRTKHPGSGRCTFHEEQQGASVPPTIPRKYSIRAKQGVKREQDGKVGRPAYYHEEFVDMAYRFCLMGSRDVDLARLFEVDVKTLWSWKQEHPEFGRAILDGREAADSNVAAAMYHAATGYEHPEEKIFQYEGGIITHDTTKRYPPNVSAGQLWLFNRQPRLWKDQRRLELSGSIAVEVSNLSDSELLSRLQDRRARIENLMSTAGPSLAGLSEAQDDAEPN